MRSIRFLTAAIFLLLCSSFNAKNLLMVWEWQFSIKNLNNQFISENITVYYYNSATRNYEVCGSGTSLNYGNWGSGTWNAVVNMETVEPDQWDATFKIPYYEEYIVRIGNSYVRINDGYADETFYYTGGTITTDEKFTIVASGTWTNNSILLKNNFAGGGMYINSEYHSNIPLSGETVTRESSTFPHTLTAVDEQTASDGYKMLWNIWSNTYSPLSQELNSAGNYSYEAQFDKECHLTFQTDGKPFTADEHNYTVDETLYKREGLTFSAAASSTNYNDVAYTFLYWKKDGVVVSNSITVSAHATYVAWYTAKPTVSTRDLTSSSQIGQNVTITWDVHPNANVTGYNVYRKVKRDGVVGPETFLTSYSSRYSTSYTDYEYTVTNDPGDDRLMYDVRPIYTDSQNSAVESDPYYETIAFGIIEASQINNLELSIMNNPEIPKNYSIGNYPNPFNPTTTINYQLPQDGFVTIKVYDMLGKEIATLVDGSRTAGYHNVNFDASRLTSGIYIYTINANNFVQSKKMILMK